MKFVDIEFTNNKAIQTGGKISKKKFFSYKKI